MQQHLQLHYAKRNSSFSHCRKLNFHPKENHNHKYYVYKTRCSIREYFNIKIHQTKFQFANLFILFIIITLNSIWKRILKPLSFKKIPISSLW